MGIQASAADRELPAAGSGTNRRMEELLHGEHRWLEGPVAAVPAPAAIEGGITSEAEEGIAGCPSLLY